MLDYKTGFDSGRMSMCPWVVAAGFIGFLWGLFIAMVMS
jgi:hypothetical protein